jgi:hypothetical protein
LLSTVGSQPLFGTGLLLAGETDPKSDFYDLLWYFCERAWAAQNLVLLNHALEQIKWDGPPLTLENWRPIMRSRIKSSSWSQVMEDALPFLASQDKSTLLTKKNLLRLLA